MKKLKIQIDFIYATHLNHPTQDLTENFRVLKQQWPQEEDTRVLFVRKRVTLLLG